LEEDKSSETLQEVQVQFAKTSNDMQLLHNQIQQIQFALGILIIGGGTNNSHSILLTLDTIYFYYSIPNKMLSGKNKRQTYK
jgi:hypothetical protein